MKRTRRRKNRGSFRWRNALKALALLGVIVLLVWLTIHALNGPAPDIVARVLFSETANCTPRERLLVAGVMQNRIHNPPFGHSANLQQVVSQPGAFSCINDSANANWRKTGHPEQMTAAERAIWQQCVDCARGSIPAALGPSGRPLVYYHDKSIAKPRSWDNARWRAVREVTTEHFIFYSIVPATPAAHWFAPHT